MASFWRQGTEFPVETCIFYNFGYNKDFPFPQINMDTAEFRIAIHTRGMAPPNRCTAVLISGKYLQQVDEVMQIVESVAHSADTNPFAAFLFRQSEDEKIFINSTLRKRYSPTMVSPQNRKYVMCNGFIFNSDIFTHSIWDWIHLQGHVSWRCGEWKGLQQSNRQSLHFKGDGYVWQLI